MIITAFNPNHFAAEVESTAKSFGLQMGFYKTGKNDWSEHCLVGGKTFPVKEALKAAGARWNGLAKAWEFQTEATLAAAILSLNVEVA